MFPNKITYKRQKYVFTNKIFFNKTGNIYITNNIVFYQVCNLNEIIKIIISHFKKYPLITQKQSDFILFYLEIL